jgi:cellulase (glycosyl hydrolase family 5)
MNAEDQILNPARCLRVGLWVTIGLLLMGLAQPVSTRSPSPLPAAPTVIRAGGGGPRVTAHDGKFWLGTQKISLRGVNMGPSRDDRDYSLIESWGMNFVRMEYNWWQLEPNAPVKVGADWNHAYDADYVDQFRGALTLAGAHGLYVLIKSAGCAQCGQFQYPDWSYETPYNSHGATYPSTDEGRTEAEGDFWTDPLRKEFMIEAWTYLIGQVKDLSALIGYEVLNEPQFGYLATEHATTQTIVDWQLSAAQRMRQADPNRIIFFTTRGGYAPGVKNADFSGFVALGNVAFDVHDYFGARWGDGYGQRNPSMPDYEETRQDLYAHVLKEDPECDCGTKLFPYIGTTLGHVRFIQHTVDALRTWGIPLLVGEFGLVDSDPGATYYFANVTSAANYIGVSWAASGLKNEIGLLNLDGSYKPWTQIVVDAAKYQG